MRHSGSRAVVAVRRLLPWTVHAALCAFLLCALAGGVPVAGQQPAAADADTGQVQLNFPQEIEIKALVDYVSQRLGIKILYDEQINNKRISVRAPEAIPVDSLLGVLESALKMKELALVDADAPGWKRIVSTSRFPNIAPAGDAAEAIKQFGKGVAVTQAFVLKRADPEQVGKIIEPFLTKPGANSIPLSESRTLIVTDYATNLLKIARWVELMDQPVSEAVVEFVRVEHMNAGALVTQVVGILTAKSRAEGVRDAQTRVELVADERTNQIMLIGAPGQTEEAMRLIRSLDVSLNLVTTTYRFETLKAAYMDRLVQTLILPEGGEQLYRSVVDEEANVLIVTTTAEIHKRIESLRAAQDAPSAQARSPIRFYKVKNLPVNELLETIRSIEHESESRLSERSEWARLPTDGRTRPARSQPIPGPNRLPTEPGSTELPQPPAVQEPPEAAAIPPAPLPGIGEGGLLTAELLGRARVTADLNTNTLIVVAEPAVQRVYAELIEQLDRRRYQVLIEAKFVIIDTSDDYSIGVEVSGGDRQGAKRLFAFTSYGLSTVDPVSGALSIIPGLGFNGTLVNPDVADAVLKAVATHSRARVTSSPRVVVTDNATGQLTSVQEVPFTSVNASQTVATTSFAGFADAGTTITVTPRVSDDDHVQLDFAITLNTFNGTGSEGVPPPRQTQEVTSQVTMPDGYTVIVGGLGRTNQSQDYTGFPFVDRIPILRALTGLNVAARSSSSFFVFVRPIILRDDKFEDLKFISGRDMQEACIPADLPVSQPIWIR